MTVQVNSEKLGQAIDVARAAANVAHEAQPYPQDKEMFQTLGKLAEALSDKALQLLDDAVQDVPEEEPPEEEPAPELPEVIQDAQLEAAEAEKTNDLAGGP